MMLKYSELMPTTEFPAFCACGEYKGMVDCPECGTAFCVFCEGGLGCPGCGSEIDYSA